MKKGRRTDQNVKTIIRVATEEFQHRKNPVTLTQEVVIFQSVQAIENNRELRVGIIGISYDIEHRLLRGLLRGSGINSIKLNNLVVVFETGLRLQNRLPESCVSAVLLNGDGEIRR